VRIKRFAAAAACTMTFSFSQPTFSDSLPPPSPKPEEFVLDECQQKLEDFVNSDTLPAYFWPSQGHYETMGFEFKKQLDEETWLVRLPKGWTRTIEEEMYSASIIDENSNQRVHIYCGENEELELVTTMLPRYRVEYEYLENRTMAYVIDAQLDGVIYVPDESFDISGQAEACESWLNQNYPGHQDPLAYWE
jgi:hypothetical protein